VDTYLVIASKRDDGRYADRALPDDVVERILDAGRLSGSAKNRQPWRFLVVESRGRVAELAECVHEPANVLGAALVVALAGKGFDLGRAAQSMMLAAWNDGVTSTPNGLRNRERAAELLELDAGEEPGMVLTFGYPARQRDPESRPAAEWSERANRRRLSEVVRRI
jgi:nitroreductase